MIKKGDKELADAGITVNPIAMSLKSAKTKKTFLLLVLHDT